MFLFYFINLQICVAYGFYSSHIVYWAQAAFPAQEKRLDALILCTTEVFMYLEENLKLTPQSMSDRAAALDELEDMHQQVWSLSLSLYMYILYFLFGLEWTLLCRPSLGLTKETTRPSLQTWVGPGIFFGSLLILTCLRPANNHLY